MTFAPTSLKVRLNIGVTGHRAAHSAYAANADRIGAVILEIFDQIDQAVMEAPLLLGPNSLAPTRLHTLMVDGTDQAAAEMALEREWELVSPLPFGARLNAAINALPSNSADAKTLLDGKSTQDAATQNRAEAILTLTQKAKTFECSPSALMSHN